MEEIQLLLLKILDEYGFKDIKFQLNKPTNPEHGDFTTNIALVLSPKLNRDSLEIAKEIKEKILNLNIPKLTSIEIAGHGFLNFKYEIDFMEIVDRINSQNSNYGKSNLNKGKVMVEYGQPNTHKALQIGHLKSGVIGLSIIKLLENYGYEVIKANYFSDIGMHVAKCLWGILNKYYPDKSLEKISLEDIKLILDDFNKLKNENSVHHIANLLNIYYAEGSTRFKEDKEIEKRIREINIQIYSKSNEAVNQLYKYTREISIEHQTEMFNRLGIKFDRQYPESEIYTDGKELVLKHPEIFIKDDGAIIFPGEKYKLKRWVFITSENIPTYSAKDLGLAYKKFEEYPDLKYGIVLTSVEQNDYFKAVIKALELIDNKFKDKYLHFGYGWLLLNNKKTSSKTNKTIKLVDILDDVISKAKTKISSDNNYSKIEIENISNLVGISALKFFLLSYEIHKDINYDPDKILSLDGFSGPYVMYGYVRANGILSQKGEITDKKTENKYIPNTEEIELIKLLDNYPQIAEQAAREYTPHKLCHYLYDLTNSFNHFYAEHKVVGHEFEISRLKLVNAYIQVVKNGLTLLGIDTTDKM